MSKFLKMEGPKEFDIFDFHLIVVGSSLSGLSCAKEAATLGAKVCVISDGETFSDLQTTLFLDFLHKAITCGCMAQSLAPYYSWTTECCTNYKNNWKTLMDQIKVAVSTNLQERIDHFVDKKVSYVEGSARFLDSHKVVFEDTSKRIYWSEKFLIAPSGTAILDKKFPDIKGAELYGITLLDLMNTSEMGGEILVVGDSSGAVQLAALLAKLFEVTLFCRKKKPVPEYDQEMLEFYVQYAGFKLSTNRILLFITQTKCGRYEVHYIRLHKRQRGISLFDKVIFVPEQKVNLKKFQLDKAGLKVVNHEIPTNENFKTNVSHIYALGTAAKNPHDLCHMPYQNGRQLARVLFGKRKCVNTIFDQTGVLLGFPGYSFVGLSEEEALRRLGPDNVDVYVSFFKAHEILNTVPCVPPNFLKVICINDRKRKILGMHFLGPHAPSVMQGYATALRCGQLTMDDLHNHAGIHPTVSREFTEVWITKRSGIKLDISQCCS